MVVDFFLFLFSGIGVGKLGTEREEDNFELSYSLFIYFTLYLVLMFVCVFLSSHVGF